VSFILVVLWIQSFTLADSKVHFKMNSSCQTTRDVFFIIADTDEPSHIYKRTVKTFRYTSILEELRSSNDNMKCFKVSFAVLTKYGIIHAQDENNLEGLLHKGYQYSTKKSFDDDNWLLFLQHFNQYNDDQTLVLLTSSLPDWVVDRIARIQFEKSLKLLVAVMPYLIASPKLHVIMPYIIRPMFSIFQKKFTKFYKQLVASQLKFFVHISSKHLWDIIKGPPNYDRFQVVKNLNFSKNIKCFTNKTLNIIYEQGPSSQLFYEQHFIQLLVVLENILITKTPMNNNKLRILVNGEWKYDIMELRGRYEYKKFFLNDVPLLASEELGKKETVFLHIISPSYSYFDSIVSSVVTNQLKKNRLPTVEVVRVFDSTLPAINRHEERIYATQFLLDSVEFLDLVLDSLIDVGC